MGWIKEGAFDDGVIALLEKQGDRWRVYACEIGVTDCPRDSDARGVWFGASCDRLVLLASDRPDGS